jgi:hypothetical protein
MSENRASGKCMARRHCVHPGWWRIALVSLIPLVMVNGFASGQIVSSPIGGSRSTVGSTPGLAPLPQSILRSRGDDTAPRHYGPTEKFCLLVEGWARTQAIDARMFEHVILARNSCAQTIKMDVCYYGSQHCILMSVPGYSRRELALGTMQMTRDFRFEFKERFY